MNRHIKTTTAIALSLVTLVVGIWLGDYRTTSDIITEVEQWHTARLFEDGSWRIVYNDGTLITGCKLDGLCQD